MIKHVLLAVPLAVSSAVAAKKPVTIEVAARPASPPESMGTPVWAPDEKSFAFVAGKAIWLYEIKTKARRQLASLDEIAKSAAKPPSPEPFDWENRRVRHETLQWLPSGKTLLVFAGGDLFLLHLASGKTEQLTSTPEREANPALSPDGRSVSFHKNNELHLLDIESRATRPVTSGATPTVWNGRLDWVYPEELELGTAHWWSPDSKNLAYLQFDVSDEWIYPHADLLNTKVVYEPQRYPKAGTPNPRVRLGVVAARGGATSWIDTGSLDDALLARVDWLPDSSRIAVQRLNRVQNVLTLLFANASTGKAQPVLTERSPHWVNVSSDLRFLKKRDAFLWSSEQSGFRHLYLYSYDGKQIARLTDGEWEVKSVAGLDEGRNTVYYVSRERGPLTTDLASVDLAGGTRKLVTRSKGQHGIHISPKASYFVDTYQSLTEPVQKTLHSFSGSKIATLQPPNPEADDYEYSVPEIVTVKSGDGALLYGRVVRPRDFHRHKKYPAVVMVYGGPHAQSVCECYTGLSWEQALAQRGFVVWQLDNRGTAGRGLAWETRLFRRLGKQELDDQEAGIRHLISLGYVDPQRIGMFGWSYGGFMTMYTLLNSPSLLRAGIAGAAVTDWRNYDTIYTERYLGLPSENEEGYRLSSPIHQAANLNAPLLLVHNLGDDNVLFQQMVQLTTALQNANKQYESLVYPQKSHGVTGPVRKHLLEAMTRFFERNLK
jgi:dipeptidyl-peptidase-4